MPIIRYAEQNAFEINLAIMLAKMDIYMFVD